MARMDHNPEHRVSFGIEEDVRETIAEIVEEEDHESRSHWIRSLIYDAVEEFEDGGEEDAEGFLPADEKRRAVYRTALDESTDRLRVQDHHISEIALATQMTKDSIRAILHQLRRRDYTALMGTPPDAANAKPVFRVKSLSVRPEEWPLREQSRTSELTDAMTRAGESTCLEHHFIEGGDTCLKCGEPRETVEDREQCENCGGLTFVDDLDDGACPVCRGGDGDPVRADGGERR